MFSPSLFIKQQMELPFDHSTKSLAEILREAATSANSHPRHPSKLGPLLGIEIREISRAATRHDKLAANFLAMVQLASLRLWLRAYESTAWFCTGRGTG
jgi:transposase